jgi:hypothetical protein
LHLESVALVRESCLHNQFHLCELTKVSPNFDFIDRSRSILFIPLVIAKIISRYNALISLVHLSVEGI